MREAKPEKKEKLRDLKGFWGHVISVLALAMAFFQFYTAYVGTYTPMVQRGIHMAFGFSLLFFLYPPRKSSSRIRLPLYDAFLALGAIFVFAYAVVNFTEPTTFRMVYPTIWDKIAGTIAILMVLEVTRRSTGLALPFVVIGFLLYAFLGQYAPGSFSHAGLKFKNLIIYNFMSLDGIFGIPTGASAKTIFVLIIFGVTMLKLGGGEFFIEASTSLFGKLKGGPAKIAIASSAFFATITGVGPANVAATGVFTIPLMKKAGYNPHFAGAVEAVASSGGQIMPPVMGIAAFIMAEILGITYLQVCLAALVPAILYFVAVYTMVHLEAVKYDLKGMSQEKSRPVSRVMLEGWNFILPVLLLVFMIGYYEASPQRAGFFAMVLLIALAMMKQLMSERKIYIVKILKAIESGVVSAVVTCAIVGAVGIIMSIINLTGIGLKLSTILISLSHGILILLLVITMFASLILGMGMTTVACYIIVAILAAPALINMGINPIAAHLFVFYFGIISAITPPVALSAFIAAIIADSPPMKTAWTSFKLGLVAFILPYMFVYSPTLLLQGDFFQIALSILTATIGIIGLALAIQGCFFNSQTIGPIARIIIFLGAVLMIHGGISTDLLGFIVIIFGLGGQAIGLVKRRLRFRA